MRVVGQPRARDLRHLARLVEAREHRREDTTLARLPPLRGQQARQRELQMKKWKRAWKIKLIEEKNLDWEDLYPTLF